MKTVTRSRKEHGLGTGSSYGFLIVMICIMAIMGMFMLGKQWDSIMYTIQSISIS